MKPYLRILLLTLLAACSTTSAAPAPAPAPSSDAPQVEQRFPQRRPRADYVTPPPDTRTESQKALAACGGSGGWACRGSAVKPVLAAGQATPIIPASWTTSAWFIDPSNSATCASDTNSGTSATCTGGCSGAVCTSGIGPIKTWQELNVHRWGCLGNPQWCPRLRQTTTITFLSSHTDNTDPVQVSAVSEAGTFLIFQGNLGAAQQVCTGSMTIVSAKNRNTPQLLVVTLPCAGAANELVVDSTTSSRFWTYSTAGGGNWNTTQPLTPQNTTTWAVPTEVVPVNLDTVTVYTPTQVNFQSIAGYVPDSNGSFNNAIIIYQLTGYDPGGAANDQMFINTSTLLASESQFQRIILNSGPGSEIVNETLVNVMLSGGYNTNAQTASFYGGAASPGAFIFNMLGFSGSFNDDFQAGTNASFNGWGMATGFYIGSGKTLTLLNGAASMTGVLWGPGGLNVSAAARLQYPAGATGGATNFKLTGTMSANGQTKTCLVVPGAASSYGTCNITLSGSNLDANLGTTSGCLGGVGGLVCNFGP